MSALYRGFLFRTYKSHILDAVENCGRVIVFGLFGIHIDGSVNIKNARVTSVCLENFLPNY